DRADRPRDPRRRAAPLANRATPSGGLAVGRRGGVVLHVLSGPARALGAGEEDDAVAAVREDARPDPLGARTRAAFQRRRANGVDAARLGRRQAARRAA